MCRPDATVLEFAAKMFGVENRTEDIPFFRDLRQYNSSEKLQLLQVRVLSFAKNTWFTNRSALKPYIAFCKERNFTLFPVDVNNLDLCCFSQALSGKSSQVIENLVNAVIFASKFLGYSLSRAEPHIKRTIKFVAKLCVTKTRQKDGLQSSDISILWDIIDHQGGLKSLTLCELRTFVMLIFCHRTLCRFSCASEIKLSDVNYTPTAFEFVIRFSKTDQEGASQTVNLPNVTGKRNPFMLLCLYINALSCQSSDNSDIYLFPPFCWNVLKSSWEPKLNCKLSYSSAYQAFKKFLMNYGLNPKSFALHSPRIGGTSDMFENKIPCSVIDRQGRWKNELTKFRYCRNKKSTLLKYLQKVPKY